MPAWNEIDIGTLEIELLRILSEREWLEQKELQRKLEKEFQVSYTSEKAKRWTDRVSGKLIAMERYKGLVKHLRSGSPQAWKITEYGKSYLLQNSNYELHGIEENDRDNLQLNSGMDKETEFEPHSLEEAREYAIKTILMRRGQSEFREKLLKKYGCCLTIGCNAKEALEAAHVKAYASGGRNHLSNGLLLRSDIHTLFDVGMISIDSQHWVIKISNSLKETSYEELSEKKVFYSTVLSQLLDKNAKDALNFRLKNILEGRQLFC